MLGVHLTYDLAMCQCWGRWFLLPCVLRLGPHVLGVVTHQTGQVPMLLLGNHYELAQFHILNFPKQTGTGNGSGGPLAISPDGRRLLRATSHPLPVHHQTSEEYYQNTTVLAWYSANLKHCPCLLFGPMIAPLTFYLVPLHPVAFTLCQPLTGRQWRAISTTLWQQAQSVLSSAF